METSNHVDEFIRAGLDAFGIEADETDLAVMGAVHQLFWGPIGELLELDISEVEPERNPDLSRSPERR